MAPKKRQALGEIKPNTKLAKAPATNPKDEKTPNIDKVEEPTSRKRKSDAEHVPAETKKTKTPKSAPKKNDKGEIPNVSTIYLDGEETHSVPIYDTCDMVRSKIKLFLKQHPSESNASLARRMKSTGTNLSRFREKKGYDKGNTSSAFYDAYVYLEKIRIAEGKPKSKDRVKMEELWSSKGGFDTTTSWNNKGLLMTPPESMTCNKYGETTIIDENGKKSVIAM